MYNRYLRNDDGVYTRMPMQDAPRVEPPRDNRPPPPPPSGGNAPPPRPPQGGAPPPPPISQEASQFFSRILDKLPLKGVDTADILLLLILFFLFEEKADDELLVALGLLLILSHILTKRPSEERSSDGLFSFFYRFAPSSALSWSTVPSGSVKASSATFPLSTLMPAMR